MQNPSRKYVFIITYGRSGSTLLRRILGTLPGCHITGENYMTLYPLFLSAEAARQTKKSFGEKPLADIDPWFGADRIVPRRYARRLVNVFIDEVIAPPEDARIIGFKEIRYFEGGRDMERFLDFMAEHFAPAKFVMNTRNWEAVAKSSWWKKQDPQKIRGLVETADQRMHAYAGQNPDRAHVIDYSDFSRNDPHALDALFDFLGETPDHEKIGEIMAERLTH
ncbi:sulfotransferase [Oceanicella sp. SM1341]|uniref:sulfotransferase n=1 Tax=Oceanicella sp. SM1341 TaxID=1548889 RepID=UPI00130053B5|nr:sulfotransferase [Oceanicella sp. SM1341]